MTSHEADAAWSISYGATACPSQVVIACDQQVGRLAPLVSSIENAKWIDAPDVDSPSSPAIKSVSLEDSLALSDASATLEADPSAALILVYASPEDRILCGEGLDSDAERSMRSWSADLARVLMLQRRYRDRTLLVNGSAALTSTASFSRLLRDLIGCEVDVSPLRERSDVTPSEVLKEITAAYAVRADTDCSSLIAELEASSVPIFPKPLDKPFAALASALADIEQADGLRQEANWLQEQLHKTQEELEPFLLASLNTTTQTSATPHSASQPASSSASSRELRRARKKISELSTQLANREAVIRDLYASKSWKITAPLRRFLDAIG